MGFRLLIYLIILGTGALLGYKGKISIRLENKLNLIQSISLFYLLFIMGIKIGLDEQIIRSFVSIGYRAGIIAIFSITVTILITTTISRFIICKEGENKFEP